MRARSVEELERILWNDEISVEIKIGAGGGGRNGGVERGEKGERERERAKKNI